MANRIPNYTLLFDHKYIVLLENDKRAFVKAAYSSFHLKLDQIRETMRKEADVLRRLRGLAVPCATKIPAWAAPYRVFGSRAVYLAEVEVVGDPCDDWSLSCADQVAIWCFVVEQLAAFRRCGVIYLDIKASNVLMRFQPLRITVVDFDSAIFRKRGLRMLHGVKNTSGYRAPEACRGAITTERCGVYELGIFLPYLLTGYLNTNPGTARLEKAYEVLRRAKAGDLVPLLRTCLATEAARRPADYEKLMQALRRVRLPELILGKWRDLRGPFEKRLGELRFERP